MDHDHDCDTCDGTGKGTGGWPGSLAREYARAGLGPASAAAGPGLARTAQRLLDTLDGRCLWSPSAKPKPQPSECLRCHGIGKRAWPVYLEADRERLPNPSRCAFCRGTGHNLAGVLPAVEWPAVVRRKHNDSHEADLDRPGAGTPSWIDDLNVPLLAFTATRVVPRGEHRSGWDGSLYSPHWPRWRRGELRHAERQGRRLLRLPGEVRPIRVTREIGT